MCILVNTLQLCVSDHRQNTHGKSNRYSIWLCTSEVNAKKKTFTKDKRGEVISLPMKQIKLIRHPTITPPPPPGLVNPFNPDSAKSKDNSLSKMIHYWRKKMFMTSVHSCILLLIRLIGNWTSRRTIQG